MPLIAGFRPDAGSSDPVQRVSRAGPHGGLPAALRVPRARAVHVAAPQLRGRGHGDSARGRAQLESHFRSVGHRVPGR